jgi:hypothetical protein
MIPMAVAMLMVVGAPVGMSANGVGFGDPVGDHE